MYNKELNLELITNVNNFVEFMINNCPSKKAVVKSENYIVSAYSILGLFSLNLSKKVILEIPNDEIDLDFINNLDSFCNKNNI